MAWKKVTVRTLPAVDTDFEKISDEVNAYIKTNYVDNNKRTWETSSFGDG